MEQTLEKSEVRHGKKEKETKDVKSVQVEQKLEQGTGEEVLLAVFPPTSPKLSESKVIRAISPQQILIFKNELLNLFEAYIEKTGQDRSGEAALFDFYAVSSGNPSSLFLLALDPLYRCFGYLISSVLYSNFDNSRDCMVWQLMLGKKDEAVIEEGWKMIKEFAKANQCRRIMALTRRDPKVFGRFVRKFNMKQSLTVFEKKVE